MSEETDRELLELAANAAGYRPDGSFGRGLLVVVNAFTNEQKAFPFDPINDDGDALRLAVKLGIRDVVGIADVALWEGECPYAVTRRAIVRAAAEIGRQIDAAISAADSR